MTVETSPILGSAAVQAIVEEVGSWDGVETGIEPRFGGPAFYMGRRQLGHLHDGAERGAWADLPLPRRVRDELIEAGRARVHGAMPNSGWLTVPVRTTADLENAIEVFRLAYERPRRGPQVRGLIASAPHPLPFAPQSRIRAFVLRRAHGDLLVYTAPGLEDLGGVTRQYLNHWHEASFATPDLGIPVFTHEAGREHVAEHVHVRATFSKRHMLDDDFEVIPTPGHTPDATAFLWNNGEHRILFTGDTIMLRDGEWKAAVLDSSDRAAYVESLRLIRSTRFDVIVPWVASADGPYLAMTDREDAQRRIDAIIEEIR
jgi:Luciferase/Metallo-beta-lactamase superfamily